MWLYKNKPYTKIHDESFIGFIYKITFLEKGNEKFYIGKKQFFSKRKIAKTKKELNQTTDKRLSKKKVVVKEVDWQNYQSSNEFLKKQKPEKLKKEILVFCSDLRQLAYQEVKHQFLNNVLESDKWLNANILGKFFIQK